jgi:hypothetical protein
VIVTHDQLRLRMRGLVAPMCGEIEAAADAIRAGTTDPAVRRQALEWKLAAVPALRQALYQPDPIAALNDTWILLLQMADHFTTGTGREALGPASAEAAAVCRRMESEFRQVVASCTRSGDVSRLRTLARDWAASHPIRHSVADREPVPPDAFGREFATSLSIGEAADQMSDTLDDLGRKLEVYSSQMPRQARWEVERLTADLTSALPADRAFALSERAVAAAEKVAGAGEQLAPTIERVTERLPSILSAERVAALEALHRELTISLAFLQEERIASLEVLSRERSASLGEFGQIAATERAAMVRDLEQVSTRLVDHAIARLERLVAVVLLAVAVAALVLLLAARWLFGRPAPVRLP